MLFEPGKVLRKMLIEEFPLQIVGVINPLCAKLAAKAGFRAIYLSGAGVANADLAMPDLGLTTLDDVLLQIRRISAVSELPLIVDVDTGWGSPLMIRRTFFEIEKAGAAGAHIEDQHYIKRCGHRPGKKLVSIEEMSERIRAACRGRIKSDFMVIARTDAYAEEGIEGVIRRASAYQLAGADMLFAEAIPTLEEYKQLTEVLSFPILANMTEFGKTPMLTLEEFASVNVSCVLYPLSAFRAMNAAAETCYKIIRKEGTQLPMLDLMQSREELYAVLDYHRIERELDEYLDKIEFKDKEFAGDE